jgi:OmpA-OmpF porin, OOP family
MNRTRLSLLSIPAFLLASSLGGGVANAQSTGFSLDRYAPSPAGSMWFALDSLDMRGSVRPAFALDSDFAYKGLAIYSPQGATQNVIVYDQLFLHAAASLVLVDRLRFAFDLPAAVYQHGGTGTLDGITYTGPNKPALGDLRLDADVRLFGQFGDPITMALGMQLFLPTGNRSLYAGDGGVQIAPHVLAAGQIGIFTYAASLGFLYHTQNEEYADTPFGGELTMSGSAGLLLDDKHLLIGPEVFGRTDVTNGGAAFSRNSSPVEGLLGIHGLTTGGWQFGVGGGTGFAQGLGSPAARIVASISYSPPPEVSKDRDGDGIVDEKDACPDTPGVKTDNPETNGCPPPPPPPVEPPPPPDPDRDKDGILNEVDACPDTPGEPSPDPKRNGCPKAMVEHGTIKIIDQVKFRTDSAEILPESNDILSAVRKVLLSHPEIKRVDVEGHTDNRGAPAHNQDLSERRAASVVDWLVARDIDKSRLISHGYGQTRPIDTNDTDAGRQNNRRVEFHILEGAGSEGSSSPPKPDTKENSSGGTSSTKGADTSATAAVTTPAAEGTVAAVVVDKPHTKKEHKKDKTKIDFGVNGSAFGVVDTNIFDKGANTVQAVGFDVNSGLNLGVPLSKRISWISSTGLGTNYRDGVGGSVGDANALRVDFNVVTGFETLLMGKTSLAGRKVKKSTYPNMKLTLQAKYALWANPLITQKPALDDETIDALEPSDDDEGSDGAGGGGGEGRNEWRRHPRTYAQADSSSASDGSPEGAEGDADQGDNDEGGGDNEGEGEPAEVSAGPQTFSNPNLHNHLSGIAKLSLDTSKKWSFGADAVFGRDFVDLEDTVETNPQYDEITGGLTAKYKLLPKLLWLTGGYVFERRFYDEDSASGASQDFYVQGAKFIADIPLKRVKLKASYDIRFKIADAGSSKNATRNQIQLSAEVPIGKVFSIVDESRFTYTLFDGSPNSTRFIELLGAKVKF